MAYLFLLIFFSAWHGSDHMDVCIKGLCMSTRQFQCLIGSVGAVVPDQNFHRLLLIYNDLWKHRWIVLWITPSGYRAGRDVEHMRTATAPAGMETFYHNHRFITNGTLGLTIRS